MAQRRKWKPQVERERGKAFNLYFMWPLLLIISGDKSSVIFR